MTGARRNGVCRRALFVLGRRGLRSSHPGELEANARRYGLGHGQQIGSTYDPTGNSTQGRVTALFRGIWARTTDMARTNVQALEIGEVA